jgi:hypothetical protein
LYLKVCKHKKCLQNGKEQPWQPTAIEY